MLLPISARTLVSQTIALKKIAFRTVASVFSALLFLCAALQYNDVDPELWVLIYGVSASVPLLIVVRRYSVRLFWLSLGLCVAGLAVSAQGAITYFSSYVSSESLVQDMSPTKPYIEETREFLGALIAIAILIASRYLRSLVIADTESTLSAPVSK